MPGGCVVVQSDRTLLVEVDHPDYPAARDALARFAEIVKSPEHVHTYRVTPLSLWNAATAGWDASRVIQTLKAEGILETRRGAILVKNRDALQARACLCNEQVKTHFEEVLRGVYPTQEPSSSP